MAGTQTVYCSPRSIPPQVHHLSFARRPQSEDIVVKNALQAMFRRESAEL